MADHIVFYCAGGNYRTGEVLGTVTGRSGTVHTVRLANGERLSINAGWVAERSALPIAMERDQDLRMANRVSLARVEPGCLVWVQLDDGRIIEGRTLERSAHGVLGVEDDHGTYHRFLAALVQWGYRTSGPRAEVVEAFR